eukprot:6187822-Pleurochrysis_carterae.AAC.1
MPTPSALLGEQAVANRTALKTVHKVVTCWSHDLCKDALLNMTSHNLMSLPVYKDKEQTTLVGCVDMIDMVAMVIKMHDGTKGFPSALRYAQEMQEWKELIVQQAMHQKKQKAVTMEEGGTFASVVRLLIDNHVHRVLVQNSDGGLVDIITQSDVVNALHENLNRVDLAYLNRKISQFACIEECDHAPFVVDKNAMAIEAFHIINDHNVSALPVVDKEDGNKLLGTISVRDIRTLSNDGDFPKVLYVHTAEAFCAKLHARVDTKAPLAASLQLHNTFRDAVELLHKYKIHRVWICDKEFKVIHVLSLYNILTEAVDR